MTPASSPRLAGLLIALPLACAPAAVAERHQFERPCMGTLFRIVVHSDASRDRVRVAAERAFEIAASLEATLSDYRADSELGKFHRAPAGEWFEVSREFMAVLQVAARIHYDTGGAFDVANGALTRLWRHSRRRGELPEAADLKAAREASGLSLLEIDRKGRRIRRRSDITRLDFGGIGKGYAADRMLQSLRADGFPVASIAASGDIAVGDAPPGTDGWRIELRPFGDSSEQSHVITLANAAVSSSGDAEQAIEIGGRRYSHIVDPATGLGLVQRRAASCIAPSAAKSDALATALCLLDPERGRALIEARPSTEALILASADAVPIRSRGFPGAK